MSKKTQKAKITGPSDAKSYECEVCQCAVTAVGTEDRHWVWSLWRLRNCFTWLVFPHSAEEPDDLRATIPVLLRSPRKEIKMLRQEPDLFNSTSPRHVVGVTLNHVRLLVPNVTVIMRGEWIRWMRQLLYNYTHP